MSISARPATAEDIPRMIALFKRMRALYERPEWLRAII